MLFMVIERYKIRDPQPVYASFRERGRMLPEGLAYIDSLVEPDFDRCFQLMVCDDAQLLQEWASHSEGLVEFEFVPVLRSSEAASVGRPNL